MPKREGVSLSVIKRLPRYYRFLGELLNRGVTRISSRELAQMMQLTASQIRQDLNCFGGFGQQGYGYNVAALHKEIGNIMGLDRHMPMVLIGAGNLGQAIASHLSFETEGFTLVGIFDNADAKIGRTINGLTVRNIDTLERFCNLEKPTMAVLCVPRSAVESLSDRLYALGIRCFWNFSHYDINMKYGDAIVENVHLNDSLMTLCYRITNDPMRTTK